MAPGGMTYPCNVRLSRRRGHGFDDGSFPKRYLRGVLDLSPFRIASHIPGQCQVSFNLAHRDIVPAAFPTVPGVC